jgi:hypothetical protein
LPPMSTQRPVLPSYSSVVKYLNDPSCPHYMIVSNPKNIYNHLYRFRKEFAEQNLTNQEVK